MMSSWPHRHRISRLTMDAVSLIATLSPSRQPGDHRLRVRDVDELLAERGIDVNHVTVYRWVQTFLNGSLPLTRLPRVITPSFVMRAALSAVSRAVRCGGDA